MINYFDIRRLLIDLSCLNSVTDYHLLDTENLKQTITYSIQRVSVFKKSLTTAITHIDSGENHVFDANQKFSQLKILLLKLSAQKLSK